MLAKPRTKKAQPNSFFEGTFLNASLAFCSVTVWSHKTMWFMSKWQCLWGQNCIKLCCYRTLLCHKTM